jgi:hypothetical protein
MDIRKITKENQSELFGSSYYTRTTYLQAMRQFMADDSNTSHSQTNSDIEEYFRYEKWVSHHIQEILGMSDRKTTSN